MKRTHGPWREWYGLWDGLDLWPGAWGFRFIIGAQPSSRFLRVKRCTRTFFGFFASRRVQLTSMVRTSPIVPSHDTRYFSEQVGPLGHPTPGRESKGRRARLVNTWFCERLYLQSRAKNRTGVEGRMPSRSVVVHRSCKIYTKRLHNDPCTMLTCFHRLESGTPMVTK